MSDADRAPATDTPAAPIEPGVVIPVAEPLPAELDRENIYTVLAAQARTHTATELWLASIGGWVDAIAIAYAFPGLSWLGWVFTTIACYGTWGLADRYADRTSDVDTTLDASPELLEFVKALATAGGTAAGLIAAYTFLTAAFHNWIS